MGCRGVHLALQDTDAQALLDCPDDESLIDLLLDDVEERVDDSVWHQPTDKAWDAIHRCLTDGTLRWKRHRTPLGKCVLGGRHLHRGPDYIVCYLAPDEVKEVAAAIGPVDEAWLRQRYFSLRRRDYGMDLSEQDFGYTWAWFGELKAFYRSAADAGRHVVFAVDQ